MTISGLARNLSLLLLSLVLTACQLELLDSPVSEQAAAPATAEIKTPLCPWIVGFEENLAVSANWSEGEQKRYEFFKYRLDRREDGSEFEAETVTEITVSVIERTANGYIVEWLHGPTELVLTDGSTEPSLNEALELPEGLKITYTTDQDGIYMGLYQVDDLIAYAEELYGALSGMIAEESGDPEAGEQFKLAVQQILSNPALFESMFARYIQGLHSPHGIQFDGKAMYRYQDMLPNPLGGQPILTDTELQLEKYSAELSCARISIRNIFDPESARQSMLEVLTKQAIQMGVAPPNESDVSDELNIMDRMYFDIDLQTGWLVELEIQRTIQFGPAFRLDRQRMVRMP